MPIHTVSTPPLPFLLILTLILWVTQPALAIQQPKLSSEQSEQYFLNAKLNQQRQDFQKAFKALQREKKIEFKQTLPLLVDYPLYPYLIYERLKREKNLQTQEVIVFIERYQSSPLAKQLTQYWLSQLAKHNKWQEFIVFLAAAKDMGYKTNTQLQCTQGLALLKTDQTETAFSLAQTLWLVGHSQPKACDSLFNTWLQSEAFDDSLYWQRAQLALKSEHYQLARYLASQTTKEQSEFVNQWRALCQKPEQLAKPSGLPQTTKAPSEDLYQQMLGHCLKRLVSKDRHQAIKAYEHHKSILDHQNTAIQAFFNKLARHLSYYHDSEGPEWLEMADPKYEDIELIERRMRYVLADQNWSGIIDHISRMPKNMREHAQWQYWCAIAQLETSDDQHSDAKTTLHTLTFERSYYGLLASQRLQQPFNLNLKSRDQNPLKLDYIASLPAISRMKELQAIEWPLAANREWFHAINKMTESERGLLAELAFLNGWHYHAIIAAAKSDIHDHLLIRFPTPHQTWIEKYTQQFNVPADWVYGVIRQESAFKADARSPVGARGLMQLMPATAKHVARKHALPYRHSRQLSQPEHNIRLGIRYLADLYDRFDGNWVAATAAYNAGPSRSKAWLATHPDLPTAVWVETIPIKETREYVKNIQTYQAIYQAQLANLKTFKTLDDFRDPQSPAQTQIATKHDD